MSVKTTRGNTYGTGVCVKGEGGYLVLTNHHVAHAGSGPISVWSSQLAQERAARLLASEEANDLGALVIDGLADGCTIASSFAPQHSKVWHCGYPMGQGPVMRYGTCFGYARNIHGEVNTIASVMFLTSQAHSGDSGSGVFNDRGELVGLIYGATTAEGHAACIHRDTIHQFLQTCWRSPSLPSAPPASPAQPPQGSRVPVAPHQPAPAFDYSRLNELESRIGKKVEDARSSLVSSQANVLDRLPDLGPALNLLPWLLGAAGIAATGPIGLVATFAFRWLLRVSRREERPSARVARQATEEPKRVELPEFVGYEKENAQLKALKEAMVYMGNRNPGCVGALDALKNYAKQIESGQLTP